MTNEKRSCLALICASQVFPNNTYQYVFDYTYGKHRNYQITKNLVRKYISIFDYQRCAYVGGEFPNLFDYHTSSFIFLEIKGRQFTGFDYESGAYFSGEVEGNQISIFDYAVSRYFIYQVG